MKTHDQDLLDAVGGGIERLASKLFQVGQCHQAIDRREDDLASNHSDYTDSTHRKFTENRGDVEVSRDVVSEVASDVSSTSSSSSFRDQAPSSPGCCGAFLGSPETWDDDDMLGPPSSTSWEGSTTINTFRNKKEDDEEPPLPPQTHTPPDVKATNMQQQDGPPLAPVIKDKPKSPAPIEKEEKNDDKSRIVDDSGSEQEPEARDKIIEEEGPSVEHKGGRRGSFLFNKRLGGKKPNALAHCVEGRCSAALDGAAKSINLTSSTLFAVHSSITTAMGEKKWSVVLELIRANPEVLKLHSSGAGGGTILHTLSTTSDAPDTVVLRILSIKPTAAGCRDAHLNTPLHLAARQGNRPGLVKLFSDYYSLGAAAQNDNLDTPLHIAAAIGAGGEDSVRLLLNANPEAITSANRQGRLPLHKACLSPKPSVASVRSLLVCHGALHHRPYGADKDGNSPLCVAIKANASLLVQTFADYGKKFFQPNKTTTGVSAPLHAALLCNRVDSHTLGIIVEAGRSACATPLPNGEMPIHIATRRGMCDEIVHSILVEDLPITPTDFCTDTDVVTKEGHNYSWHHILTGCEDRYSGVISKILSALSLWCRKALATSLGPDGRCAYDASSEDIKDIFRFTLCVGGRFEVKIGDTHQTCVGFDASCNVLEATDLAPSVDDERREEKVSEEYQIETY